jgi:short-subunit dehydrogenase
MGGRLTLPASGYYHATKYAVEAITDALRYEVKPFGISVSLVAPGPVGTRFEETADAALRDGATPAGPYGELVAALGDTMARTYRRRITRITPDRVAAVIEQALQARAPRTRYLVGVTARGLITAHGMLPDRLWDSTLRLSIRPDQS